MEAIVYFTDFAKAMAGVAGKRLTYERLTGKDRDLDTTDMM